MPMLVIPPHIHPRQVDDFPASCKRSQEGALYVRPGTQAVTAEELAHLQDKHRHVLQGVQVIPDPAPEASTARAVEAPARSRAEAVEEMAAPAEEAEEAPRPKKQHR